MNASELSKIVNSLLDRPIHFMTDRQLARWAEACEAMEQKARLTRVRRNWTANRLDAEAEIRRRARIDARDREYAQMFQQNTGEKRQSESVAPIDYQYEKLR